ncbi:MAG: hypothetical protein KDD62_07140, partial [Bdellovibrionales bacterium]|nr:hypothetical protein [Bdellovibrionales bacterium]
MTEENEEESLDTMETEPASEPEGSAYKGIDLPSGEALTLLETRRITANSRVQLILLVGAVDSGKSSLIAGLFHMFQRGTIGDYFFAGSESLIGF